jgi:hypothetical protein
MLKATWRRLGSPAWAAIGLLFLLPTLAEAQLFPNRTIRRERPPCSSEPPFNAQVRRDYFGYYPTCWSRFPAGWDCPGYNPEKPNLDQSIKEHPFGQKRPGTDTGLGPDEGNPDDRQPMNPGDNPIPPVPNAGRSPFELDPNPTPKPPAPNPGADPFTTPPAPAPSGPGGRNSTSTGVLDMPSLPATSPSTSYESPLKPGAIAMAPDATLASSNTTDLRPDLGPLPSPPVSMPNNLTPPADPTGQPILGTPAPAQAPRRRGFLSSLFGPKNTQNR